MTLAKPSSSGPSKNQNTSHRMRRIQISSVTRALNLIGDRWNQLILQEAFRGAIGFEELRAGTGATRNTLSNRLRGLVANGIMEQRPQREGGVRKAYFLTEKGRALFDWMLLVWSWGIRWEAFSPTGPTTLIHTTCRKAMLPVVVCEHCNGPVKMNECRYEAGEGAGDEDLYIPRLHRRRRAGGEDAAGEIDVVDLTADRWTGMVISAQYFGLHRFDDMQQQLDVASNILTDRLKSLAASGIFERRIYEISPPRYEYWMTTKGKDLYPQALVLLLWGDDWLAPDGPPVHVIHKQCGNRLGVKLICSVCGEPLDQHNVVERRTKDRPKG